MMKSALFSAFFVLAVAPVASAMSQADIKRCNAMAATFKAKTAEIDAATAARDELAETAELAGAAWEDVEVHRVVSADHEAAADKAEADYTEARQAFERAELALQSQAQMFNDDLAAYNASCAAE